MKFKVGDYVKTYDVQHGVRKGHITEIDEIACTVMVCFIGHVSSHLFYPQQCRKIKKVKTKLGTRWWINPEYLGPMRRIQEAIPDNTDYGMFTLKYKDNLISSTERQDGFIEVAEVVRE